MTREQLLELITKPIRSDAAYRRIVELLEHQTVEADTVEGRLYEVLADMAENYDKRMHPIAKPSDPIEHILFRLDAMGRTTKDLEKILDCSRARVWEVLNRRRALTLDMIRALETHLGANPAVLVQRYELTKEAS